MGPVSWPPLAHQDNELIARFRKLELYEPASRIEPNFRLSAEFLRFPALLAALILKITVMTLLSSLLTNVAICCTK
jgi:hypothetical protein